jgi:hypothetical protein
MHDEAPNTMNGPEEEFPNQKVVDEMRLILDELEETTCVNK